MSRGFVKEDDQEEAPFIPPRASLGKGLTNYVTPTGLALLHEEKRALEHEKEWAYQEDDDYTRRRSIGTIKGKMKLLDERINSARVLKPEDQPSTEVRFGANVQVIMNGRKQNFQLVGVDEANVKNEKIAFSAPIAIAITGKKVGDVVEFNLGKEKREIKLVGLTY